MADVNNVEIFAVGTWNGFKFVKEDLTEIIKNTDKLIKKGELRPRIKLGHSSNQILEGQSDGDPSLGTAGNFRIKNDKIISDFANLPDIIFTAIQKERFTSVSVEMEHVKHFGWFITAVSLLGADIPAVKTIEDLQKFLSDAANDTECCSNIKLACSEPILNTLEKTKMPDEKNVLQLELEKRELERQLQEMTSKNSNSETELLKLKELEKTRKFSDEKEKLLAPYKEQVKAGKLTPALMTKLELAIDAQRTNFSEDSQIMLPINIINDIAKAYSENFSQKETAMDDGEKDVDISPDRKVEIEVSKVITKTNMSYSDASEAVFAANPQLEKEYAAWVNKFYMEV